MMNEEIYEALEKELAGNRIHEDVDDILLEMAEGLAEKGILDRETSFSASWGKTKVTAVGICTEEDEEVAVRVLTLTVGKKKFEIDDYLL